MPFDEKRQKYHELKVWPEFFGDLKSTRKNFEIRRNDRNFQTGDRLRLREWDQSAKPEFSHSPLGNYTSKEREVFCRISYVLPLSSVPGLINDERASHFVVLGLEFDNE